MIRARSASPFALGLALAALLGCGAGCVLGEAPRAMEQDPIRLAESEASAEIVLRDRVETTLTVQPGRREITPQTSLTARLEALGSGRALYLAFADVAVPDTPGIAYNVYLNRPATDAAEGAASAYYAGTLSFFNSPRGASRETALNVTRTLERLRTTGALDSDLRVTIVPAGEPSPGAAPRIGRIALVAR